MLLSLFLDSDRRHLEALYRKIHSNQFKSCPFKESWQIASSHLLSVVSQLYTTFRHTQKNYPDYCSLTVIWSNVKKLKGIQNLTRVNDPSGSDALEINYIFNRWV